MSIERPDLKTTTPTPQDSERPRQKQHDTAKGPSAHQQQRQSAVRSFLRTNLALFPLLIAVWIIGYIVNPQFLTLNNLLNTVLTTAAVLGLLVIAESVILVSGYFDLSLQSQVAFAPMLLAVLVTVPTGGFGNTRGLGMNYWLAFVIMIAVVSLVGFVNGILVAKFRLNAFIVTLAVLILLQGFTLGLSGGQTFTNLPPAMTALARGSLLGLETEAWIFIGAFILAGIFMTYTKTGRGLYAIGGNIDAARAAGIRVDRNVIGVFVFGALLSAFAGLVLTGRISSVVASQGSNIIFNVFAACVLGGISLKGGRGTMFGAAIGVVTLASIQNILLLSDVPSFWIDAAYGAIILLALITGAASSSRFVRNLRASWRARRGLEREPT